MFSFDCLINCYSLPGATSTTFVVNARGGSSSGAPKWMLTGLQGGGILRSPFPRMLAGPTLTQVRALQSFTHPAVAVYVYCDYIYHILLGFDLYEHGWIIFTSNVLLLSICAVCVQESFKTYPPIEEVFLQLRPADAFAYQSNYGAVSALQCSPFHRCA